MDASLLSSVHSEGSSVYSPEGDQQVQSVAPPGEWTRNTFSARVSYSVESIKANMGGCKLFERLGFTRYFIGARRFALAP